MIVEDVIAGVEQVIGIGIRFEVANPIFVNGFVTKSGSHFLSNFLRVSGGWTKVSALWDCSVYKDVVSVALRNKVIESIDIEFMVKIIGMKMFRVETYGGRCALFGAKTLLYTRGWKILRMRKVSEGIPVLCGNFKEGDNGKNLCSEK